MIFELSGLLYLFAGLVSAGTYAAVSGRRPRRGTTTRDREDFT